MKKVLAIVLLAVCLVALCGCSAKEQLEKIETMLDQNYSKVDVKVTQKSITNDTLTSSYNCAFQDDGSIVVTYNLREYLKFEVDGDNITAPSEQTQAKSGSVTIKDGQTIASSGDAVEVDFSKAGMPKFDFSESNLANVKVSKNVLTADVTNLKAFWGGTVEGATNIKVKVDCNALNGVILSYVTTAGSVEIAYTFTK